MSTFSSGTTMQHSALRVHEIQTGLKARFSKILALLISTALLTTGMVLIPEPQKAEATTISTMGSSFTVTEKTQKFVPSRTENGVFIPSRMEDVFTEIANIEIQHPNQVLCVSSTCTMNYSYRYAPIGSSWDYYSFSLVDVSTGSSTNLGYLSKSSNWIQRQHSFTASSGFNSSLQFRIGGLGSNETAQSFNPATYFISAKTIDMFFLNPDLGASATSLRKGKVYAANKFKIMEYGFPARVNVSSPCMNVPIALAAVDIASGLKDNPQVWAQSSFYVSVLNKKGREVANASLLPNSQDWNTRIVDDKFLIEVCGLVDERKKKKNYRFQARFSTTQYGLNTSINLSQKAVFRGVVKYTTINCLRGNRVRVIRAAEPVCPENFEETDLRVANGKLVLTTIKCLRGVDVINVTAPVPSCPSGYTRTTLPTKNGKIKSTITCVKGLNAIKVNNFNPKCPVGFREVRDS